MFSNLNNKEYMFSDFGKKIYYLIKIYFFFCKFKLVQILDNKI
jgi:hypothetical protein